MISNNPCPGKIPYPKSVWIILTHQGFERFAFWGIAVVLPLFLRNVLGFSDDSSTSLYHCLTIFASLSPIVGAVLADSYFGKFWTITGFSILYLFGILLLTLAATPFMSCSWIMWMAVLGMILTAFASGSIKPCIISLGGNQFTLPQQQKEMESFFPNLLIVVNFVLVCTAILTPLMRQGVACFGESTCYPLTFAVPFSFVLIASLIFIVGKRSLKDRPVERNVVWLGCSAIAVAVKEKIKRLGKHKSAGRYHWLDYAENKFDKQFIGDLKRVLRMVAVFLPVTTFWALFDQQFSRWTFQASRLNGRIFGFNIKPDQVAITNFVFTFLLIPIFDRWVYPLANKWGFFKTNLQKAVTGCFLASVSFLICAALEFKIEAYIDEHPTIAETRLTVTNHLHYPICLQTSVSKEEFILPLLSQQTFLFPIALGDEKLFNKGAEIGSCKNQSGKRWSESFELNGGEISTILMYEDFFGNIQSLKTTWGGDNLEKSLEGDSKMMVACSEGMLGNFSIIDSSGKNLEFPFPPENCSVKPFPVLDVKPDDYEIVTNYQMTNNKINLEQGGNYALMVTNTSEGLQSHLILTRNPNRISIQWLIPQYLVMSAAEVLVVIPLTSFAYEEAPVEMKSLLQVVNLIPQALGGILVVLLAQANIFESQAKEFFLFSGVNLVSVLILIYVSKNYIYVRDEKEIGSENQ